MPKRASPLSAAEVRNAKPGRYGDGDGLYLLVRSPESAFWVFRYTRAGKMREMGLGRARGHNSVSLSSARAAASPLHRLVSNGIDPLEQRAAEAAAAKSAAQAEAARAITFRTVAKLYIDGHEAAWRNAKHASQWTATLTAYAYPHFGDMAVGAIGTAHVLAALEPIWTTKPETASRVRGRVESVLDYAKTREWRSGENPARWKGHLDQLLPARSKVAKVEHHAALPWAEMPAFMAEVSKQGGVSALALRFAILTASRTGEVIGARWGEIDLQVAVWTIPAGRMKAGREHRVPLSASALAVLSEVATMHPDGNPDTFVFPGMKHGRGLSNMALLTTLRRMQRADLTAHGFRSSFRDWAAEATTHQREVAESALAHVLGNKAEQAYQRGDMFEKRRGLMDDWAVFCGSAPAENHGKTDADFSALPSGVFP